MIRENQKILNNFQIILDQAMVAISLLVAYWLRFLDYQDSHLSLTSYLPTLILLVPLQFFLYYLLGLYEPRRRKSLSFEIVKVIQANFLSMLILFSLLYLIKAIDYSRQVIILFEIITSILTTIERIVLRIFLNHIRRQGYNKKHVLVIGTGRLARRLIRKLKENSYLGYEITGVIDDDTTIGKKLEEVSILGEIRELETLIRTLKIDDIFITISTKNYDKFRQIIHVCEKSGVRTQIVPDYAQFIPAKPEIDEIDGIPLINIRHVPLDNFIKTFSKRTFDIVSSFLGISICLPLFALIAISVKLDSPGPVFLPKSEWDSIKRVL